MSLLFWVILLVAFPSLWVIFKRLFVFAVFYLGAAIFSLNIGWNLAFSGGHLWWGLLLLLFGVCAIVGFIELIGKAHHLMSGN